jgi:3-dehydroquinate dehydratase II
MKSVLVVHGPNLDRLGTREPDTYGSGTLAEIEGGLIDFGARMGLEVSTFQSNHEGELVEAVHQTGADGVVINPGALTHTSRALADAIRSTGIPTVEVHISNVRNREPWRAVSMISEACAMSIYGRGVAGYRAAIRHLLNQAESPSNLVRYGPHPDNVGDLRVGDLGLVILIHGGVWRHQFTRDTIESLAVDLHRRGHSTWNIEHRRLGDGGGWPGSAHDVLMALEFTPRLEPVTGPVTIIGHSAGGYLGMWSAPRASVAVDLLVGLAPVVDLELGVADRGELEHESRILLQAGAPARVDPGPVPTVAVHPVADPVVSPEHSTALAGRLDMELLQPDLGHFDLLDPTKHHWEWVVARLPG